MKDVESIIKVYGETGSKRETARILGISKNTVKLWLAKTEDCSFPQKLDKQLK